MTPAAVLAWIPLVLLLDRRCLDGRSSVCWASAPGCCCSRCCDGRRAHPRAGRRRRRFATAGRVHASPAGSTSTSTGCTTCRGSCRPGTGWSTSARWPSAARTLFGAQPALADPGDARRRRWLRRCGGCSLVRPPRRARRVLVRAAWRCFLLRGRTHWSSSARSSSSPTSSCSARGSAPGPGRSHDPILGIVAMGNPPSGAAGGYGFFDAAALLAGAAELALLSSGRLTASRGRRGPRRAAGRWWRRTLPPSARVDADRSVNRPPASSTIGCSAAMSHSDTSGSHDDVDRALGDQHVRPEVAEGAGAPDASRQRRGTRRAAVTPSRSATSRRGTRRPSVADAGDRDAAWPPPASDATRRCPRAAHQRRPSAGRRHHADHDLARRPERDQRGPHRDAADEVLRAVDRVDDPAPRRRRRSRRTPRRSPRRRGRAVASAADRSSTARSASVTGVRSGLVSTRRSSGAEAGQRDLVGRVGQLERQREVVAPAGHADHPRGRLTRMAFV